jgi:hypothetical protein
MLGEQLLRICSEWQDVFSRSKSFHRAVSMAVGILCGIGRATTTRAILALGRKDEDWSADYRLCSSSPWEAEALFTCVVREALTRIPEDWCILAYDDTRLKKTGKKIQGAQYHRDPLSPAFNVNLMYGLRFLQCSLLISLHRTSERSARSIPISFESAPCAKKPGKKGTPADWDLYKKDQARLNLSVVFGKSLFRQRQRLDELGARDKLMLTTVDGSFCNRKCLGLLPERTAILARTRKDAKLCFAAPAGTQRIYSQETFTPESVLKDGSIPYETGHFVFGGAERELRFKCIENVLWQGGTKTRRLTLLVLAPIPYQVSPNGPRNYRDPAFLICTRTGLCSKRLIQAYLDRWQIEVNHKDEKDILGVGEAQVWSKPAIPRQPALAVAAYSILMLAALAAYGPGRTKAFLTLPKWRKQQRRPSLQDLLNLLRTEFADPNSILSSKLKPPPGFQNLVLTAAA